MQKSLRNFVISVAAAVAVAWGATAQAENKTIAYLTPSRAVSFWNYIADGVQAGANAAGYDVMTLDSENDEGVQMKHLEAAIARRVAGIVMSPTSSAAAPALLALAEKAKIPVVICDIGTVSGTYVSFIASDNLRGARGIGQAAARAVERNGWASGSFGIIAIPQARKNGQLRSEGFRAAMKATTLGKEVQMREMKTFTVDESYQFAADMLTANPDLRLIFVQADDQAIAVAAAVSAANRQDDVLVAAFDGTPELLKAIMDRKILGAGMQQPYLMGSTASRRLAEALAGSTPPKLELIPILTVTSANAQERMSQIKLNVFANKI